MGGWIAQKPEHNAQPPQRRLLGVNSYPFASLLTMIMIQELHFQHQSCPGPGLASNPAAANPRKALAHKLIVSTVRETVNIVPIMRPELEEYE